MRRLTLRRARDPQPHNGQVPDGTPDHESHSSIESRLRWSYLISSTLPLLIVGALLLNISLANQQNSVYTDQRSLASRASRSVSSYIADLYVQIENYETVVRPNNTALELWQDEAKRLQERNYPNLTDFAVLDRTGVELLRVNGLQSVAEEQLRDLSADASVKRSLEQGATSFSPIGENGSQSFVVTLPLNNDAGTIIGALRAQISAAPITDDLRADTANTNSYAYLVQATDGRTMLGDGSPTFQPPADLSQLLTGAESALEYRGARDQQVIGAFSPVVLPNGINTGWAVIAEQPSSVAFAGIQRSVLVLALLVILVGSLALIWAFRQAQSFLRPLAALRSGATAVGAGHLDHRIVIDSDDELGEMAQAFNQMAGHLQDSLAQIERQNDRLRHGLALARDIQIGLLPDRAPWGNDEIAVYARSIPAYEVGGDFYTYLALSEGRAAIAIGDISGKGVGAALLMSLTSSAVETQGRQLEHPAEVLIALNQLLAPRLKANHMNAALLFAVFDPHKHSLRVANAGMIAPILINSQGCNFLEVGGLPVGAFPGAKYQELTVEIQPGDALLLVSDGVVEAHNPHGDLFGFERLEATVAEAQPHGDVRTLVELVLSRVQEFMGDAEQHDDITLVAVRPTLSLDSLLLGDEEQAVRYAAL